MLDCPEVQDRLLRSDDLQAIADDVALREHLRTCAECERISRQLVRLEEIWRTAPLPAACDEARAAFLAEVAGRKKSAEMLGEADSRVEPAYLSLSHTRSRRVVRWFVAVAAAIAIAVSPLLVFHAMRGEALAEPMVQLLSLNFAMANEESLAARERLFATQVQLIEAQLAAADLFDDERELAKSLLHNALVLIQPHDPLDCADGFGEIANKLLVRIDSAAARNDATLVERLGTYYCAIVDEGVNASLERAPDAVKASNPSAAATAKERLEKAKADAAKRNEHISKIAKSAPEPAKKGVKRMLDRPKKPQHRHKGGKK